MANENQPKQGMSCGKMAAIGCAVAVIVAIVAAGGIYVLAKRKIEQLVATYTEEEPRELPTIEATKEEVQQLQARVNRFEQAMERDQKAEPLVLTGREINLLMKNSEQWKEMSDSVHVTIEGDQIGGEISFPLGDKIKWKMMQGRYLNGEAQFTVSLQNGNLQVYATTIEVKGKPLPKEFMTQFRQNNLAQDANTDPEMQAVLSKLESIKIEDGKIHIIPKPAEARKKLSQQKQQQMQEQAEPREGGAPQAPEPQPLE